MTGIGAVICHGSNLQEAKNNIAAMHSRKFNEAQTNYSTTDQELFTVVNALETFEVHLLGIPFTIVTDHKALEYMMKRAINSPRIAWWMQFMQRFDFETIHTPGETNILTDALSRLYENTENVTIEEIAQEEMKDINTG